MASLSIKIQLLLLAFIVAIPAVGIIVYSGIQMRETVIHEAQMETERLANNIAAEQQNLVTATQQLITVLSELPEVKARDRKRVEPILGHIIKLNAQYSNLIIADRKGLVWATAVPTRPPYIVSDRRYFKNALASGQLSSGEYLIGRASILQAFGIGHPLRNENGEIVGVIGMAFRLDAMKDLLNRSKLPSGTSFMILDHKGTVLYRAVDPERYIGKQSSPEVFKRMQEGPDVHTFLNSIGLSGEKRIATYRKLRLPGEEEPYMYVLAGIPLTTVVAHTNKVLIRNLSIFASCLFLAILFAWFIGKRSIADRVTQLEKASQSLARGCLRVRVSDLVSGGELGRLGETFDEMAHQLSLREQALAESERNYRNIFNTTKDAIFVHDVESGSIIECNKTVEEIFGYSREEIINQQVLDAKSSGPPHSSQDRRSYIKKAFEEGPQQFEWQTRRKNGEPFWTEVVLSATQIDGAARVLAVVRDITERKQAEEEKSKLETQLQQAQKMEAVGQLGGGVAHDFNNILSAIVGYSHLSLMKMSPDDPNRHYIEQILASSERAAVLTQGLLAFSRKQTVNLMKVDLNDVIVKFEKLLLRMLREDIELKTRLAPGELPIMADRGQMEQVLMNLVTNSRDAMPQGGHIIIETSQIQMDQLFIHTHGFGRVGDYALISVTDTGTGIPETVKDKIFEPFFTTKEEGKGTGLGLSMAYGIVNKHKGYINAYTHRGIGTTFKVYIPVSCESADAGGKKESVENHVRGGTETVLIAEDDATLRAMVTTVLRHYGYIVIEAIDGSDAVSKFKDNRDSVRLVILDGIMPKKNGKEAWKEIQELSSRVKAIFISGYAEDIFTKDGIPDVSPASFIQKPSPPLVLAKRVRELLDESALDG